MTFPNYICSSCHDQNLADLQNFLENVFGINKIDYPDFASSFLFEFQRKDIYNASTLDETDYYIQITFDDVLLINMPFSALSSAVTENSFKREEIKKICKLQKSSFSMKFK